MYPVMREQIALVLMPTVALFENVLMNNLNFDILDMEVVDKREV